MITIPIWLLIIIGIFGLPLLISLILIMSIKLIITIIKAITETKQE